jgi:ribonuclease E
MATKMLIDAAHPEETRVVVVKGNRPEEFDFETAAKAQLKGNIYLAKVTRVEPSLQAAFVDYGGNRHGFLSFNEIHPDYYQIPVADRKALIAADARESDENDEFSWDTDTPQGMSETEDVSDEGSDQATSDEDEDGGAPPTEDTAEADEEAPGPEDDDDVEPVAGDEVESVGGDEVEEARVRRTRLMRSYKIQEVIKRRQILLIQVVKEERGNKGAALTTYISLAGRYCVLMPNTARGGGISRKITSGPDRRRLKTIVNGLDVPEGMALIVRTAGAERSKAEIRRDFDYLYRLWDSVRELTLNSRAPALVHEEANLIKRSIRDLYSKDIEEVLVEGEAGYKIAKSFMRMLMPSHAKRVQPYSDKVSLFSAYRIDQQLDSMLNPDVKLKSGGYIVIGTTEALVAIDVNSGRSTRERNIEETATRTNLEAAEEIARQLRLRDLAGLIVIDFIDMERSRNSRAVERKLKECLKPDRARIQMGRISHFGLLEMSRQRLRPSLLESSTNSCPACSGSGIVRSTDSAALFVLRALEDESQRSNGGDIEVAAPSSVALYLLNHKRPAVAAIEERLGVRILIAADDNLLAPDYRIERQKEVPDRPARARPARPERTVEAKEEEAVTAPAPTEGGGEDDKPRKRRRRGKRGGRRRARRGAEGGATENPETADSPPVTDADMVVADAPADAHAATGDTETPGAAGTSASPDDDKPAKPKRRRKPTNRRRTRRKSEEGETAEATAGPEAQAPENSEDPMAVFEVPAAELEAAVAMAAASDAPVSELDGGPSGDEVTENKVPPVDEPVTSTSEAEQPAEAKQTRRGWWRR